MLVLSVPGATQLIHLYFADAVAASVRGSSYETRAGPARIRVTATLMRLARGARLVSHRRTVLRTRIQASARRLKSAEGPNRLSATESGFLAVRCGKVSQTTSSPGRHINRIGCPQNSRRYMERDDYFSTPPSMSAGPSVDNTALSEVSVFHDVSKFLRTKSSLPRSVSVQ